MKSEEYHRPSFRARRAIRSKLMTRQKLYSLGTFIHRKYCLATHFLHTHPDYLIIGVARSGSTSLYQYLIQHPDVGPALTKQIHFFDRYFDRGIEWYKVCFPFIWNKFYRKNILKKNFVTGEATVHYIMHPLAPKRISKIIPNVKLIVMLRNPIDRAYSHYKMEYDGKNETLSFEEAIKQEEKRLEGEFEKLERVENYFSLEYPHHAYLTSGIYIDQLKRWMQYFPKEQFLILKSEDFSHNPSVIYNQILEFLNLPKFELPEYKRLHEKIYEKMNPDTRRKLIEFFRPYNEQLYSLLNRNFHWDD
ncbi:MAG: sulfotransferase domain-containing protein [Nitrosopumilaceae archaeon]